MHNGQVNAVPPNRKAAGTRPIYEPDTQQIRQFLENVLQRDWFHLLSSDPDGNRRNMTGYVAESVDDAIEWIKRQVSKGRNVYHAFNAPSHRQSKKAAKDELRYLYGVHVDLDLPKDMDRNSDDAEAGIEGMIDGLHRSTLPGNPAIVMSGNGAQGLWFFPQPLKATHENQSAVETVNKQLAEFFGAPSGTHNSERVLRVPGTWNFPDAVKRARGCVPVMATLVTGASRDFELADFKGLPKVSPVTIRAPAKRKDYTLVPYLDWSPYSWIDIVKDVPDLPHRLQETLDGDGQHDRSVALYRLLHVLLDFIVRKTRLPVEEMLDDRDVKKQIAELCWEGADRNDVVAEIMGHIEDHEYGRAQLGYNIQRVMDSAADDGKKPSVRDDARAETAKELFETLTKPEPAVTVLEASKAFIEYIGQTTPKEELPNRVMTNSGPAPRQPCTLANVREILSNADIRARWDAMRDEARFFVNPEVHLEGKKPWRPYFNWERALSQAGKDTRSAAEVELLLDAMTSCGMAARRELEGFLVDIAKEDRYHPLEGYCVSKPWDGVDRIGKVAACIETDNPLARRYMEVFFYQCIAAVISLRQYVRTRQGIQLSSTVVLVGAQGTGKSTFWEKLAPPGMLAEGRSLQLGQARETDSMSMCLSGLVCALNEIGQSISRSEANALKDFQSATVDKYRIAYARRPIAKPRMTVFVGTANPDFLLLDQTGSRRYLVLALRSIDWDALNEITRPGELQQLYAQAWHAVMNEGERWALTSEEDRTRADQNEEHRALPEEELAIDRYLASLTGQENYYWLNMTAVCDLLGLRYTSAKGVILRQLLLAHGFDYRDTVRLRTGERQRKVYGLPILPERYDELRLLRK